MITHRLGMINADLRELYALGKDNPCRQWAIDMTRFYLSPAPRLNCQMPDDHEYLYGIPHIDLQNYKVWREGVLDDLLVRGESS